MGMMLDAMKSLPASTAIRPARPTEADALSALALRSKAHWNYPPEQLAIFRGELTIAAEQVAQRRAHVIEEDGQLLGFYTLLPTTQDNAELEHLFVDPAHLGRGLGRALFHHACDVARRAGIATLVIQSDPNAAGFYRALGARLDRQIPSSIPGRTLPFFSFPLPPAEELDDSPRST
jgi:GNAT superfamily N-acetyltransferase